MRDELLPREALLDDNMAFLAQADEMKDCLADVDTANVCRHEMTLLCPPIALHKYSWKATDHPIIGAAPWVRRRLARKPQ